MVIYCNLNGRGLSCPLPNVHYSSVEESQVDISSKVGRTPRHSAATSPRFHVHHFIFMWLFCENLVMSLSRVPSTYHDSFPTIIVPCKTLCAITASETMLRLLSGCDISRYYSSLSAPLSTVSTCPDQPNRPGRPCGLKCVRPGPGHRSGGTRPSPPGGGTRHHPVQS